MTIWVDELSAIKHLTQKYLNDRPSLFENFNNRYTFKLYNPDNMSKNYIKIICIYGKSLLIQGSLRKWYLADYSVGDTFDDFIQQEYNDALKLVFSLLEIPNEKRKYFYFSRLEIGLNILVSETCEEIMKRFCEYKDARYKKTIPEVGCIKFASKSMSLTIYDKIAEISTNLKKNANREMFISENKDKNYLRMEFTLKGGRKRVKDRIIIGNLEESVECFNWFFLYFWDEIQKIQFSEIYEIRPIFDTQGEKVSTKKLMDFFKLLGMFDLGSDEVNILAKETNDPQYVRRQVREIQENTPIRFSKYNKISLLADIKKQLTCLMERGDCSHLEKYLVIEDAKKGEKNNPQ